MIDLCLTNPSFSSDTYKSQFDSFKTLMESQNININIEDQFTIIDDNYYIDQQTAIGDKKKNEMILPNLEEFYRYSLGLVAYYNDNLYFTFLSTQKAKYIYDSVLSTKLYPLCAIVVGSALAIIGETYSHFFDFDSIYYSLIIGSYTVGMFLALSYIFSVNISILTFIIQTFDFWYKMYNLVIWIVSGYYVNKTILKNTPYHVIASLALICVYCFLFVLDAIRIDNIYKNMFIVTVVSYAVYIGWYVYFVVDDRNCNWNPFEQYHLQYSQINFKSVFIASHINLCLFILKPIFNQMNRRMKRRYKQEKKNERKVTKDDGVFVQRSFILYKRPYVHWVLDSNIDLFGTGTSATQASSPSPTVKNDTQMASFAD